MTKLYKLVLAVVVVSISSASYAQNYWSARTDNASIVKYKAVSRETFPKSYKLFELNDAPLRQQLFSIVGANAARRSTVISLPNASGAIEQFEVFEASNFEPELQARYPQIRAFSGRGITDRAATLKLSISPQGISTMVFRTDTQNEFIEAYSADRKVYAVFKSQREKGRLPWLCTTEEQQIATSIDNQLRASRIESNVGELKVIRLAQSCNGEYSNYFGAFDATGEALVLAAFNATLTRTNGCYEKDLALHLNLIPTTNLVIFYDPATDPYTTMGAWNNQLQATLTSIIGEANYDIGHMFGASGGGGNAGCIGCVCVDNQKGRGITSPADGIPEGDNFDIDYVAHEVGHQIGANHTFSMSIEGTGVNKEVGSGITIMGYAGITNQDVAPHSIDIFHQASIQQVQVNLASKTCPVTTPLAGVNATPVVAAVSNYTIPITTPFALTGSATDGDPGDVLTYCWEQNDNGTSATTGNNSVASPTKLVGPNWLTFPATTSPTRLMPRLSTILAGLSVTPPLPGGDAIANTEALSSVGRTLNYRLTVRDNRPYSTSPLQVGQTNFTDMVVTVSAAVGPFLITSQNTATNWQATTTQTVTWSVNGTTGAPTNTSDVNILISTDGGNTFSMLLASTPNDGSQDITVPNTLSSTVRIKVEAIGNIYFDINNANITITPAPGGFTFNSPAPVVATCPTSGSMQTTITATFNGTFSNPITLSATGNPAGTTVVFGTNPLTTGSTSSTVTLTNTGSLAPGSYTITVTGTAASAATQNRDIVFTINSTAGPAITANPANQTICQNGNTSFSVTSATATSFQWEVSTNGGGSWSNVTNGGVYGGATTNTLTLTNVPATFNTYQYRAKAMIQCGTSTSTAATLTVNTPASVTTHPTSVTLCAGSNHTFTSAATGSGLTYQWQESTNGGGTWNPISNGGVYSGATTTSLTLTGITAGMNNYQYRNVITAGGACPGSVNTNAATLSVVTSVTITSQPVSSTICAGANTSFTVAGSGSGIIYVWEVSTNGGGTWTTVNNGGVYSGATTATLTITGATVAMSGYQYRAKLSNSTCPNPGTSNAATLTVNSLPAVTSHPNNSTICLGGNTSFTAAGTGTGIGYQWQVSTDGGANFSNVANGGVYSGATTATLSITGATASMNNYRYRAVISGTCPPAVNTNAAVLTVVNPVSITDQPDAVVMCSEGNTSFSVTTSSTETQTYQWEFSVNGGTSWNPVPNGTLPGSTATASGANTATLSLSNVPASVNGVLVRVRVNNVTCTSPTISNTALLTVRQLPTVGLTASMTSLLPGQLSTLTATPSASGGGTLTTQWLYNGAPITVAGNTFVAGVEDIGTYQVLIQETYTAPTLVCSNQSPIVTLTATASSRLFIFPTPNDGTFTVSYFNNGGSSTSRRVTIYDSKGAQVYDRKFSISGPYTLLDIDLRRVGTGIYYVLIGDASGNKLADGKVHVR